jgi:hypothetical protein
MDYLETTNMRVKETRGEAPVLNKRRRPEDIWVTGGILNLGIRKM